MIEFVFVIVILGILASLAMESSSTNLKQEAEDEILSAIRLARQMALTDNKHRPDGDVKWQKAYWRFEYRACDYSNNTKWTYRVGSSADLETNIDKNEAAIDSVNGKLLYTAGDCSSLQPDESESVLLTKKFGIKNITMSGCDIVGSSYGITTTAQHIAFDFFGRPHRGVAGYDTKEEHFSRLVVSDCNITFTMSTDEDGDGVDDSFSLIVKPETGYAYILD
jgi:type II secretory pathway pseudopilin PulG